jgi:hypothetical protein
MFAEVEVPLLAANVRRDQCITIWDVSYATTARSVTPIEQHVHSFLEMIPLMAILCVVSIHWGQFLALFGVGSERARFDLVWKSEPLPVAYIVSVLVVSSCEGCAPMPASLFRPQLAMRGRDRRRCADRWPAAHRDATRRGTLESGAKRCASMLLQVT